MHLLDTTMPNESLPHFEAPPVVETILGVHFRYVGALTSAMQGVIWNQYFRESFPEAEDRPSIDEIRERFDTERSSGAPDVRWQVSNRPEVPRLWAKSGDGARILQMQPNALLANWLRAGRESEYHSYSERRNEFTAYLGRFAEAVATLAREPSESREPVIPTSCVVTYINQIECGGSLEWSEMLPQILMFWKNETSDGWLPKADQISLDVAFAMPNEAGRLRLQLRPAVRRSDRARVVQLELTARGAPREATIKSALEWIDLGHEWVVRGFASMTTPEMHRLWRKLP